MFLHIKQIESNREVRCDVFALSKSQLPHTRSELFSIKSFQHKFCAAQLELVCRSVVSRAHDAK